MLEKILASGAQVYAIDLSTSRATIKRNRNSAKDGGRFWRAPRPDERGPSAGLQRRHRRFAFRPHGDVLRCRAPLQISTRFAFSPLTISTGNSAAAAATTAIQAALIRRTFHETRISLILLICSVRVFSAAEMGIYQHGTVVRMHMGDCISCSPWIHGRVGRSVDPDESGVLPRVHAGIGQCSLCHRRKIVQSADSARGNH